MAIKFVVLAACLAVANAGLLAAPAVSYAAPVAVAAPSVAAISQNTYRGFGNLGQVSTYSKALDTPFSSVRKSDVRITNPGYATTYAAAAPVVAAAPAVAAYAAPAVASYAAPIARTYAAPAVAAYAAPAVAAAPVAAVAHHGLGVAYSAAPAVAHYSFDGFGAHYAF